MIIDFIIYIIRFIFIIFINFTNIINPINSINRIIIFIRIEDLFVYALTTCCQHIPKNHNWNFIVYGILVYCIFNDLWTSPAWMESSCEWLFNQICIIHFNIFMRNIQFIDKLVNILLELLWKNYCSRIHGNCNRIET